MLQIHFIYTICFKCQEDCYIQIPININWHNGLLPPTLILTFLSEMAAETNRLEGSHTSHLKPSLPFGHFTNTFEQLRGVSLSLVKTELNNAWFLPSRNLHSDERQIFFNCIAQYCWDKRESGKEQAERREQKEETCSAIKHRFMNSEYFIIREQRVHVGKRMKMKLQRLSTVLP